MRLPPAVVLTWISAAGARIGAASATFQSTRGAQLAAGREALRAAPRGRQLEIDAPRAAGDQHGLEVARRSAALADVPEHELAGDLDFLLELARDRQRSA